jgi:hypothetical protein
MPVSSLPLLLYETLEVGEALPELLTLPSTKYFAKCFSGHSAKKLFAECHAKNSRQNKTLDKELFVECFFSNTRQRQFKNHILKQ